MPSPPLPANEGERIAAVHEYKRLDLSSKEELDRFIDLARSIFHVPIAFIAIMDTDQLWFKACSGLSLREIPREQSFCTWTIVHNDLLIIPDAQIDPRFSENLLVTREAHIRFYAGYPLRNTHGYILGTFCILDRAPRQLSYGELEIFTELARLAEHEINFHHAQDIVSSPLRWSSIVAEALSIEALDAAVPQQELHPYFFPIFEHIGLGIAYINLDGHWLAMNEGVCSTLRYQRDELLQLTLQDIINSEDMQHLRLQTKRLLQQELPFFTIEIRYIRKDRTPVWVNMSLSLIENKLQDPLFFIATIEDIDEHNRIEQERRDLLAREAAARIASERVNEQLLVLQTITDTALAHLTLDKLFQAVLSQIRTTLGADNIAILLLDAQGQYLTIRAVQGIEEVVASSVRIPLGQGFAGTIAARGVPLVVDNHTTVEVLNPVLREEIHALLGVPLIVNKHVIGVVHIGMKKPRFFTNRDINLFQRVADRLALAIERASLYEEEQRMHQETQAHAHLLMEVNARQRNFVSVVSHEFRTTLTSIQGFSGMLQNEDFLPEEVKDFATDIYQDSLRLLRMINDLLDVEKMRAGKASLQVEMFEMATLLHEQIERCKATTTQHTFRVEFDEDLPAIEADRDKISQVVINLLSNAIKYWPEGGQIVVICQLEAETVHLQVQDGGIGIPPEALTKIFDVYNRVSSDETRYIHGTGLALAIVKQIVEMHEGTVWAESPHHQGTILHVVLPLRCRPDSQPAPYDAAASAVPISATVTTS